MTSARPDDAPLRFAGFTLDPAAGRVLRDGAEVPLQPLVYRLLRMLADHAGGIVPHDALMRELWPGVHVTEASLTQAVRRLRTALGAPALIRSVARRGYRLDAEVTRGAPTPPGPTAPSLWVPSDTGVGRERELADLEARLRAGQRLVTLTGPAGVGKTRIARDLAARPLGRPVWFAALDGLGAADLAREVARAAGARDGSDVAELGVWFSRGPGLLVLDDLDEVVHAAAEAIGGWQRAAPELAVVATSRTVLGLRQERVVAIEPLALPDAVALFAARAELPASDPALPELVEALDRLPLAIELAAARARLLAPRDLLDGLRERFALLRVPGAPEPARADRHGSLEAALDASWEPLGDLDRRALVALATFRGPFDLAQIRAVLDDAPAPLGAAFDRIQALVDRSLVRVLGGASRFALLPTVRAHVEHRADPAVRRTAEIRHGRHLAEVARTGLAGGDLRDHVDDLVAACRRAAARGDGAVASDTALGAWTVLRRTGQASAGAALLGEASRAAGGRDLRLLGWLGEALLQDHRLEDALAARIAARALAAEQGLRREAALEAIGCAQILRRLGRHDEAQRILDEARAELDAVGTTSDRALVHQTVAIVAERRGDGAASLEHAERAVALYRAAASDEGLASSLPNLAIELGKRGRHVEAEAAYAEAHTLLTRLGDRAGLGRLAMNRAALLGERGGFAAAAEAAREAAEILQDLGRPYDEALARTNLATALAEGGRLDEADAAARDAVRIGRALGSAPAVARALATLAQVRRLGGALAEARVLAEEAEAAVTRPSAAPIAALLALVRVERAEIALADADPRAALHQLTLAEPALRERRHGPATAYLLAVKAEAAARAGEAPTAASVLAEAAALAAGLPPEAPSVRRIAAARRLVGA